jgi:hypothetical protein
LFDDWVEDCAVYVYRHMMEMEQMMERLLARLEAERGFQENGG